MTLTTWPSSTVISSARYDTRTLTLVLEFRSYRGKPWVFSNVDAQTGTAFMMQPSGSTYNCLIRGRYPHVVR